MKIKKPSMEVYFDLPNPGLWAYFKRTEEGNADDYRPPFFKNVSREQVLANWEKVFQTLGVKERYPGLYDFEMDMKSKVGPMSVQLPLVDRVDSIKEYFTFKERSEPIDERAINATIRFFNRAGGIRLRDWKNVVKNMRLSTNSGSWKFTKRRNIVDETLDYIIIPMEKDNYDGPRAISIKSGGKEHRLCAVLGWRGQEGGISNDDVKQRVVWMMPFLLNIEELRFYQPAIEAVQKNDLIPAYISMDRVDQEVTALFDTKGKDDDVICTDFKAFDQHFNPDMQEAARKVISSLMSPGQGKSDWLHTIYSIKFNIPLMASEDMLFTGPHGMGSGSGGTNFDECMSHKCLQFEAALTAGQRLNKHSMAYGDDGILTYPGITVDHVIQTYTRHGQVMNPTKQYVSKHDCVVLRRWHGTNYRVNGTMVGVYSTFRALGRLLAQERFYDPDKWSSEMVELRALSILENCKWSPYFKEFVDFVMTGDKYRLGLDLPGFLDNLEAKAKKAMEEFTDFLGYTKNLQDSGEDKAASSINDWEVVKYLKSLRGKA